MTGPTPGGDVRGFYTALGVELPGWAHTEAPVRCFADPANHHHQDRDASCSVNLASGAFNCHGCGAHGGAYDAAVAIGRSPRDAIELMIAHDVTQRRAPRPTARHAPPARKREASAALTSPTSWTTHGTGRVGPAHPANARQPTLAIDGDQLRAWTEALSSNQELRDRLRAQRGWDERVLREVQAGFDGERITVPIPGEHDAVQGLLRLRIDASQRPKVLALAGTRLGLVPRPALDDQGVWLVEGPSDMLSARSVGLPAIAVPGTHAWRSEWACEFEGRRVTVVMDADRPGRQAAVRIAGDLVRHGAAQVRIVELAPCRDDGYDLSDWLRDGNPLGTLTARPNSNDQYRQILETTDRSRATSARPCAVTRPATSHVAAAMVPGGTARSYGCGRY